MSNIVIIDFSVMFVIRCFRWFCQPYIFIFPIGSYLFLYYYIMLFFACFVLLLYFYHIILLYISYHSIITVNINPRLLQIQKQLPKMLFWSSTPKQQKKSSSLPKTPKRAQTKPYYNNSCNKKLKQSTHTPFRPTHANHNENNIHNYGTNNHVNNINSMKYLQRKLLELERNAINQRKQIISNSKKELNRSWRSLCEILRTENDQSSYPCYFQNKQNINYNNIYVNNISSNNNTNNKGDYISNDVGDNSVGNKNSKNIIHQQQQILDMCLQLIIKQRISLQKQNLQIEKIRSLHKKATESKNININNSRNSNPEEDNYLNTGTNKNKISDKLTKNEKKNSLRAYHSKIKGYYHRF